MQATEELTADAPPSPGLSRTRDADADRLRLLKVQALRGTAWTIAGYGLSQVLRLASNLVLTRLLAPEIFGVASIVYIFMQALEMFSDIGIIPSIVRSDRGDDPEFLNTAWSIQVVRGFALWFGSALIAWPVATIYDSSQLVVLLPVAGIAAVAQGCMSTAVATCTRRMALGRLTLLDLCTQAMTMAATASIGFVWPSIWAVIWGNLIGALARLVLSYVMLPCSTNRWAWDRSAVASIVHFGKWLTVSTMLTYICNCGDRVILGYFLTKAELGVYTIAFMMSQVIPAVVRTLAGRVFFPLFAQFEVMGVEDLRGRLRRVQVVLMGAMLPPMWVLVIGGPRIISLFYDARYHNAGWMLQVLSAGAITAVLTANVSSLVLAKGDSRLHMMLLALRAAVLLGSMGVGGWLGGIQGLLAGVAVEPMVCYPAMALTSRRYGTWMPDLDFIGMFGSAVVVALGLWATSVI